MKQLIKLLNKNIGILRKVLKENVNVISYEQVLTKRKEDSEFKRITDTKLKDLPLICQYSFDEVTWEECQELSLFETYQLHIASSLSQVSLLLAKDKDEVLGWICVYYAPNAHDIVYGIKFGSFDSDNYQSTIKFFRQFMKYFREHIKDYKEVHWIGSLEYSFVRHYIDIVKEFDGYITPYGKNSIAFCIDHITEKQRVKVLGNLYRSDLVGIRDTEQLKNLLIKKQEHIDKNELLSYNYKKGK